MLVKSHSPFKLGHRDLVKSENNLLANLVATQNATGHHNNNAKYCLTLSL